MKVKAMASIPPPLPRKQGSSSNLKPTPPPLPAKVDQLSTISTITSSPTEAEQFANAVIEHPQMANAAKRPVEHSQVRPFLEEIGLVHLDANFSLNSITASMLVDLSDSDLQSIGVTALGDRRTFLNAIQKLLDSEELEIEQQAEKQLRAAGNRASNILYMLYAAFAALFGFVMSERFPFWGATVLAFIAICIFMWPTHIAFRKRSEHRWVILLCNLFFGGTGLGWLVLLLWANKLVDAQSAAAVGAIGAISGKIR